MISGTKTWYPREKGEKKIDLTLSHDRWNEMETKNFGKRNEILNKFKIFSLTNYRQKFN